MITVSNLIAIRHSLKGKFSGLQSQKDKVKAVDFKSSDEILMDRLMNLINENLSNSDLNIDMLAEQIGISRSHLYRKFKHLTGITVTEFIRNTRLKQAATLLKEKQMNVTQIAYAVGFSNQTHFSSLFKKTYGVSPSEYMSQTE